MTTPIRSAARSPAPAAVTPASESERNSWPKRVVPPKAG